MRRGPGRRRRLRWAITLAIGIAGWSVACDSPPPDPGRPICAQTGDGGAGCALPPVGSGPDAASSPAPATDTGSGGGPGVVTATDVIMLPCTVCAHADACCKAQGLDDCGYAAACTGAHTTDEQQWRLALCQAVVSGTPVPGRAHCAVGPR
jgi:hypothetical protein